jgi:hypothetical protein
LSLEVEAEDGHGVVPEPAGDLPVIAVGGYAVAENPPNYELWD